MCSTLGVSAHSGGDTGSIHIQAHPRIINLEVALEVQLGTADDLTNGKTEAPHVKKT